MKKILLTLVLLLSLTTVTYANEVSDVTVLDQQQNVIESTNNSIDKSVEVGESNEYLDKSLSSGKEMLDLIEGIVEESQNGLKTATKKNYSFTTKLFAFIGMLTYIFLIGILAMYITYTLVESFAIIAPVFRRIKGNDTNQQQQGLAGGNTTGNVSTFWSEDYLSAMSLINNQNVTTDQNNPNKPKTASTFTVLKAYLINRIKLLVVCIIGLILLVSPVVINLVIGLGRVVFK